MDSPEHQRRSVVEYVEIEGHEGDKVVYAEKVGSERVIDTRHDVWDVRTKQNRRWWVVTNPTNLYRKSDFPNVDYVLSFHVGVVTRMMERQPSRGADEVRDSLMGLFRQMDQAFESFDRADEAEQFQAVGMQCREVLVSMVRALGRPDMISNTAERPKAGDVVQWTKVIAAAVEPGTARRRLRSHMAKVAGTTWDLVNWVTHDKNATRHTAGVALEATSHVLGLFGRAVRRRNTDTPDRCPQCASYRLFADWRSVEDKYYTLCEACGWEAERVEGITGRAS